MSFYALSSAWLFLLLGPLVLFYFLKLKRPKKDIPSLFLWRQVINDSRVNTPFQRFKRNLLLLLQIIILALIALAAMQPFWSGEASRARRLPVMIDCSASMAALDKAGGISRLDAAKQKVRELIEGLLSGQELCLVSFSATAQRRTGFTNNKRILREALEEIRVEDVPSNIEDALRMVRALSRSVSFDEALLLSDGNFPSRADFGLPFELNYQQLPKAGPNMGITSLNARRSREGGWDLFVGVEGTHERGVPAAVELRNEGEVVTTEFVTVSAGKSRRMLFHVKGEEACFLEVRLVPEGFDSLGPDNSGFIDLPAVRDLKVFMPSSMDAYRHAALGLKGVRLFSEKEREAADESFDLIVTDRTQDMDTEGGTCLYIGIVPDDLKELVSIQKGGTEILTWRRASPLLQNVELTGLVILDKPSAGEDVRESTFENLGYEVLAYGQDGPLLLEKSEAGKLAFYMLFHSDRSTLPYRIGFPVFVANLVNLAKRHSNLSEVQGCKTGVFEALTLLPERMYRVEGPGGSNREGKSSPEGELAGISAPVAGEYFIYEGGSLQKRVGASLLSPEETLLKTVDKIQFDELAVSAASKPLNTEKSLWYFLAVIAFCVALGEWWFYNRRR